MENKVANKVAKRVAKENEQIIISSRREKRKLLRNESIIYAGGLNL